MLRASVVKRLGLSRVLDNVGSLAMDAVGKTLPTPVMEAVGQLLFWPTLLWNEWLVRRSHGQLRWFDEIHQNPETGGRLLLGGFPWRSEIFEQLEAQGVRVVVSVVKEKETEIPRNFRSHRVSMTDFAQPELSQIKEAVDLVKSEIAAGNSVYLHCKAGKGRSATVALCYLMQERVSERPLELLMTRRPQILSNLGFRPVVLHNIPIIACVILDGNRKVTVDQNKKRTLDEHEKDHGYVIHVDGLARGSPSPLIELLTDGNWKQLLHEEFCQTYFHDLTRFLHAEITKGKQIFPQFANIFRALNLTPLEKVKAVILGQDPYHDDGQAVGLAFSVPIGFKLPSSLLNVYKELETDIGVTRTKNGDLTAWAEDGVLLLNATLTVRAHEANSHAEKGWARFTDAVINAINKNSKNVVFLLWGKFAEKKAAKISPNAHRVLKAPHPSGLSANRGFFGCKHFSKANEYLVANEKTPIDWGKVARE